MSTPKNTPSHTPATVRETVLDTAKQYICGDREASYGSPETSFRAVANLWIDYLAGKGIYIDLDPTDVAAMMALLKIARIATGGAKADNWIDLAGYAAIGGELTAKIKED